MTLVTRIRMFFLGKPLNYVWDNYIITLDLIQTMKCAISISCTIQRTMEGAYPLIPVGMTLHTVWYIPMLHVSSPLLHIKPTPTTITTDNEDHSTPSSKGRRGVVLASDWPMNFLKTPQQVDSYLGQHLGQVAGVSVDTHGNVYMFHRGNRKWDFK